MAGPTEVAVQDLPQKLAPLLSLETSEEDAKRISVELSTTLDAKALTQYFAGQKSPLNSQAEKERTRAMTLLRDTLAHFYAGDRERNDAQLRELILRTLIRKTDDLYQVLPCSEALLACLAHFQEDACAAVTEPLILETFLAISSPKLHVPAYNQRVRFSVLKCYLNFFAQRPRWL